MTSAYRLGMRRPGSAGQQGEVGEVEAGGHHAAHQDLGGGRRAGRLPVTARDDVLRQLPGGEVLAQGDQQRRGGRQPAGAAVEQDERGAGVPQPHLVRADPVPGGLLARGEQEVDARRGRPRSRIAGGLPGRRGAPGLPVPAAFRMRREVEEFGRARPGALLHALHYAAWLRWRRYRRAPGTDLPKMATARQSRDTATTVRAMANRRVAPTAGKPPGVMVPRVTRPTRQMTGASARMIRPVMTFALRTVPPRAPNERAVRVQAREVRSRARPRSRSSGSSPR